MATIDKIQAAKTIPDIRDVLVSIHACARLAWRHRDGDDPKLLKNLILTEEYLRHLIARIDVLMGI